jgi:hypothetical protein
MDLKLNLKEYNENMFSYYIISHIYEIRDFYIFDDDNKTEYNTLIVNLKLLNYITEINFTFVKGVGILEDIKEVKKVGNLLNFEVYLDPIMSDNEIIMTTNEKSSLVNIEIIF